jgi:hypothetical protein
MTLAGSKVTISRVPNTLMRRIGGLEKNHKCLFFHGMAKIWS